MSEQKRKAGKIDESSLCNYPKNNKCPRFEPLHIDNRPLKNTCWRFVHRDKNYCLVNEVTRENEIEAARAELATLQSKISEQTKRIEELEKQKINRGI